jgi:serine/threonine protein kinase
MTLKALIVWICFELMLYGFLAFKKLSRRFIVYQQCAWSVISSAVVIYSVVHLQFKYSGVPFKNSSEAKIMKKVNFVSFMWSFGRIMHVVLFLVREVALNESDDLNEMYDNTGFLIVAVFDFLLTELLCYYLVLTRQFIKTFLPRKLDDVSIPLVTRPPRENVFLEIKEDQTEDLNLVVNEEFSKQKGKLGSLFSGVFNDKPAVIRRIILKRVSPYVIEQLQQEVEGLRNISNPYLLQNLKVVIKKPTLDIIMPLASGGSLFRALHIKNQHFSFTEKLKIAKQIAMSLKLTHGQGRVHGHLTSHNVFLDPVLIADLGLEHLKKYVGLLEGYCNKNGWSSPEVLKDSGNVVIKPCFSDDVYSFGMILWEIMTEQAPFSDYNLKKLRELVGEQGFRPALTDVEHSSIQELIKICWNSVPSNRPSFSLICDTLVSLSEE